MHPHRMHVALASCGRPHDCLTTRPPARPATPAGSLDGQMRLIVKGRFLPKAFEGVLRRYINE